MSKHKIALADTIRDHFGDDSLIGAEVGVYLGKTSAHLLREFPQLHLILIDAWDGEYTERTDRISKITDWAAVYKKALHNIRPYGSRVTIIRATSLDAAMQIQPETLDFAFIDADHAFDTTLADCHAYWPLIRPGGILFGHDYGGRHTGCTAAYDAFSAQVGINPKAEHSWVAWWQR